MVSGSILSQHKNCSDGTGRRGCEAAESFDNLRMPLIDNFLLFASIVAFGLFVQSAAGFAAGLIIIPLMGYAGYGIPEGQTVLLLATIPQNILGIRRFRKSLDIHELRFPVLLRFLGLPVGFGLLCFLDTLPLVQIRRFLGLVILLCVAILLLRKPNDGRRIPTGWTVLAFCSSGFFAGLTGTGGPMMVAWVQAHRWSTEKTRAFLFSMYLCYSGPALLLLWWRFEARVVTAAISVVASLPLLLIASHVGLTFGSWLGRARLRYVTLGLLVVIGVAGLLTQ